MISLVGALSERNSGTASAKIKALKKAALKFARPATRIGLAAATSGASEALLWVNSAVTEAAKDEAQKSLEYFWKRETGRQQAMREFHDAVKKLTVVSKQKTIQPLIFVIDELDRCRPDFALEILEVIKHFFSVLHVHFVLGVNLNALEYSVKARYGADFDASSYLRKFISFSLYLPDHIGDSSRTLSITRYANYQGEKMRIPQKLLDEICDQLDVLSRGNQISIRETGKILAIAAILPETAQKHLQDPWPTILTTLIIAKVAFPEIYPKLIDASISANELTDFIGASAESTNSDFPDYVQTRNYESNLSRLHKDWKFVCEGQGNLFWNPEKIRRTLREIHEEYLGIIKLP